MKIFTGNDDNWGVDKVNFVDNNNVFVGFDFYQCCCESYGWFISDSVKGSLRSDDANKLSEELKDYTFDTDYHEVVNMRESSDEYYDEYYSAAVFKLVGPNNEERYLHLWNDHNGYYSHGFNMHKEGVTIHDGSV